MESFCLSCGRPLDPKADFCPHCGKPQRAGSPQRRPPSLAGSHRLGSASWEDLKRLLYFYGFMMLGSLLFGFAYRLAPSPWIEVGYDAIWMAYISIFLVLEWRSVGRAFWFHRIKPRTLFQLLAACVAAVVFLKAYFGLFDLFHWPTANMTESYLKAHWPRWSIFAMISVEPGITEEIAFRGIIQTRLSQILSRREALLIQAALFSILHLSPVIFVSHFVMGLVLGWVRLRTRHVYFGMFLHMAWNAFAVSQELS